MKKVSVIGCPGAGKTEFSRQLAKATNLPLTHLDFIYHDNHYDYTTNRDSWRKRVTKLVIQKSWIIDGNYKSTFDIRLPASNTIILLDYPTYICLWRAMKRRVQYRASVRKDMPSNWKEKLDGNFFWFIVRFRARNAKRMRELLQQYKDKEIVIFTHPKQAAKYLSLV
jgi:adenylate kinase family enzyme